MRETRTHSQSLQSSVTRSQSDGWEHTPPSSAFKQVEPVVNGATMGEQPDSQPQDINTTDGGESTPLVGPRNAGEVKVNGMKCRALIDSGSQITSITHTYWCSHPIHHKQRLQPSLMPIEVAAGRSVTNHGVLCINLKVVEKSSRMYQLLYHTIQLYL